MDIPLLSRWRPWVWPGLALGGCAFLIIRRWGYAMDDPWITFRYGRHLAQGFGFAFNPGERLEGYSNFLLVVAAAALERWRLDPFDFIRLGGVLSMLAAVLAIAAGERRITRSERRLAGAPSYVQFLFPGGKASGGVWAWIGTLYLAWSPQAATWAGAGLETPYYLLAGVLAWICAARAWTADPSEGLAAWGWGAATGLFALTAALVRVDGAMVGAGLLGFLAWEIVRHRGPRHWGAVLLAAGVFVVLYAVYTRWRAEYFGSLIPNTAEAKATGPLAGRLKLGIVYLFDWGRRGGGLGLLVALWAAARSRRDWQRTRKNTTRSATPVIGEAEALVRLAAWLTAAQVALILFVGGDWMPAARFVIPVLGFVGILAGVGLRHSRRRGAWGWWIALGALLWIAASVVHGDRSNRELQWELRAARDHRLWQPLREIGLWIGAVAPPNAWLAGTEAGIVPYYSDLPFIDMLGLVDRHIASLPGGLHEKLDAQYVLERKPRFLLLGVTPDRDETGWPVRGLWPPDHQILQAPGLRRDYIIRRVWDRAMPGQPAQMVLCERRE